jgi:Na+/H+ antiporter NhaA
VRAETRGAALLVAAAALALIWANIPALDYEAVWNSPPAVTLGRWQLSLPLREWVNSGLLAA